MHGSVCAHSVGSGPAAVYALQLRTHVAVLCLLSPHVGLRSWFSLAASCVRAVLRGTGFMLQVRMEHIVIAWCFLFFPARRVGGLSWSPLRYTAGYSQELTGFFVAVSVSSLLCDYCDVVDAFDLCRVVTSRTAMALAVRASTARSLTYVVVECSPCFEAILLSVISEA